MEANLQLILSNSIAISLAEWKFEFVMLLAQLFISKIAHFTSCASARVAAVVAGQEEELMVPKG
jgi:hypothetical protein